MFDFITFSLDKRLFAIPLEQLNKVIRAVAVTPVPDAGAIIHGVFDYHGEVMPVINLRKRFDMPLKKISTSDHFLLVDSGKHHFALVVDKVDEIKNIAQHEISEVELSSPLADQAGKQDRSVKTFLRNENGITIIYDLELLVNSEVEIQLNELTELLKVEGSV